MENHPPASGPPPQAESSTSKDTTLPTIPQNATTADLFALIIQLCTEFWIYKDQLSQELREKKLAVADAAFKELSKTMSPSRIVICIGLASGRAAAAVVEATRDLEQRATTEKFNEQLAEVVLVLTAHIKQSLGYIGDSINEQRSFAAKMKQEMQKMAALLVELQMLTSENARLTARVQELEKAPRAGRQN